MSALPTSSAGALALCLAVAAWSALTLAMDRHHEDCFGRAAQRPMPLAVLRTAGWLGLGLAGYASWLAYGGVLGSVFWLGILTLAALIVVLVGALAPRRLRWLAPFSTLAGLGWLLIGWLA